MATCWLMVEPPRRRSVVGQRRADALDVKAPVTAKVGVLGRDRAERQVVRHRRQRDPVALDRPEPQPLVQHQPGDRRVDPAIGQRQRQRGQRQDRPGHAADPARASARGDVCVARPCGFLAAIGPARKRTDRWPPWSGRAALLRGRDDRARPRHDGNLGRLPGAGRRDRGRDRGGAAEPDQERRGLSAARHRRVPAPRRRDHGRGRRGGGLLAALADWGPAIRGTLGKAASARPRRWRRSPGAAAVSLRGGGRRGPPRGRRPLVRPVPRAAHPRAPPSAPAAPRSPSTITTCTHQLYGEALRDWPDCLSLSYDGGGEADVDRAVADRGRAAHRPQAHRAGRTRSGISTASSPAISGSGCSRASTR